MAVALNNRDRGSEKGLLWDKLVLFHLFPSLLSLALYDAISFVDCPLVLNSAGGQVGFL